MGLRSALFRLNERVKRTAPGYMVLAAVVIGLLGGYGAVCFRLLIRSLRDFVWFGSAEVASIRSLDWYWIVAIPAAGGLVVGLITRWFAAEVKGHGVPEVMEAVARKGGAIRPRVVLAKTLASGVCIASGGSVGREGPIVQIGSATASTLGQILNVGARRLRTFVGCGAAAGIAATFNAPVAGALFAVEVVLGDFGLPQFSPIVISSVAATVVSHHYLADLPTFVVPAALLDSYRLAHPLELIAYVGLGLLAGLLAFSFVKTLYYAEDRIEASRLPQPLVTALGGVLVGGIALFQPGVLGVGYESINQALTGQPGVTVLLGLLLAKLLATCVTLGS
ncbi:MAG: chloride channel protein, partial [Planctomycetota bacterium]